MMRESIGRARWLDPGNRRARRSWRKRMSSIDKRDVPALVALNRLDFP